MSTGSDRNTANPQKLGDLFALKGKVEDARDHFAGMDVPDDVKTPVVSAFDQIDTHVDGLIGKVFTANPGMIVNFGGKQYVGGPGDTYTEDETVDADSVVIPGSAPLPIPAPTPPPAPTPTPAPAPAPPTAGPTPSPTDTGTSPMTPDNTGGATPAPTDAGTPPAPAPAPATPAPAPTPAPGTTPDATAPAGGVPPGGGGMVQQGPRR